MADAVVYQDATALVTGASSGIGAAFAEALAARGCDVVLVARSTTALDELAHRLRARHGVRADVVAQDLTTADAPAAVRAATDRLGLSVDVLVNNAGFASAGPFHTISPRRSSSEIALDVAAVVGLTHAYLPGMVAKERGAVINVASVAAFQPVPYMAVYGASKAFVLSFSQALWAEYRAHGVRVLAVCPGSVDTNFRSVVGTTASERRTVAPVTPDVVVRAALRGLDHRRFVETPGLANAALPVAHRFLPRRVLLAAAERLTRGTRGHLGLPEGDREASRQPERAVRIETSDSATTLRSIHDQHGPPASPASLPPAERP